MATDDRDYLGRTVQALTDGRAAYVRALGEAMSQMGGTADPISALTALLATDGALDGWCEFCYELRLHRARGYGALKAILDILAEEEPLTLTEITQRLHRTPGSTKHYLSWLEDVDLVTSRQKRYSFTDPLLRLWVRLHCRPVPPTDDDVVTEVQRYALTRIPKPEPAPALAYAGIDATPEERKSWGIIEID
jgi:DNA-binding transcriptional ArsR family regulator